MRLKRDRDSHCATLSRSPHNLTQHVRVRAVHPIEISHAHQRRAKVRGDIVKLVKYLHEWLKVLTAEIAQHAQKNQILQVLS